MINVIALDYDIDTQQLHVYVHITHNSIWLPVPIGLSLNELVNHLYVKGYALMPYGGYYYKGNISRGLLSFGVCKYLGLPVENVLSKDSMVEFIRVDSSIPVSGAIVQDNTFFLLLPVKLTSEFLDIIGFTKEIPEAIYAFIGRYYNKAENTYTAIDENLYYGFDTLCEYLPTSTKVNAFVRRKKMTGYCFFNFNTTEELYLVHSNREFLSSIAVGAVEDLPSYASLSDIITATDTVQV